MIIKWLIKIGLRSLGVLMDFAPHNMAAAGGKTVHLLNLPYYFVSQIEKYLKWFEKQIEFPQ